MHNLALPHNVHGLVLAEERENQAADDEICLYKKDGRTGIFLSLDSISRVKGVARRNHRFVQHSHWEIGFSQPLHCWNRGVCSEVLGRQVGNVLQFFDLEDSRASSAQALNDDLARYPWKAGRQPLEARCQRAHDGGLRNIIGHCEAETYLSVDVESRLLSKNIQAKVHVSLASKSRLGNHIVGSGSGEARLGASANKRFPYESNRLTYWT